MRERVSKKRGESGEEKEKSVENVAREKERERERERVKREVRVYNQRELN